MSRACVTICGKSRMRGHPWKVAHAWISMDSRTCKQIAYSLLVEQ